MEVAESSDRRDPVHPRCKNVLPQIRPELIHQQDTNRALYTTLQTQLPVRGPTPCSMA